MDTGLYCTMLCIGAVCDSLFCITVGMALCALLLPRDSVPSLKRSLQGTLRIAVAALAVVHVVCLWVQACSMTGLPPLDAWSAMGNVLTESHYGTAWLVGLSGLVFTAAAVWCPRPGVRISCLAGLLVFAAGKAGTSHGADAGDFSLPELIQWAHIFFMAMWAGGVLCAGPILRSMDRATQLHPLWHFRFVSRLSASATFAFCCMLASGVCNAFNVMHPASAAGWSHSPYAWLLGAKLMLVALATLLAGINRVRRLPVLADVATRLGKRASSVFDGDAYCTAARAFNRTLQYEAVLLLLVVIAAAVLGQMAPPTA